MSDLTVASTTDPQSEINKAAGVAEEEPKVQPQVEGDEPEEQESTPEQQSKPKSSYQKRIDKLVKERSTAKQEVEELKARLLKLEQGTNGHQQAQPQVEEAPKEEQEAPKPTPDQFATYEEFVEALADWKADQKIKSIRTAAAEEEKKKAAEASQKAMMDAYTGRMDEARERYEDFDDVAFRDVPIYEGVKAIILQHHNGVDLQYHLARNPKIARELMEMPVEMAMARAGAMAEQLGINESEEPTSQQKEPEETPNAFTPRVAVRPASTAPAPIRPVGGSSTKSSVPMDELPYEQYRKMRDQQEKARYRR